QREKDKAGELGDYLDAVDNHLLLAAAYAALADSVTVGAGQFGPMFKPVTFRPRLARTLAARRERILVG
ncbi:MAG TPA: hypothetical protein P5169_07895, partial [Kiritimatiellia bacterium]|nr:hypothetical protein [Kiritimatiellia bacterium]